MTRRIDPLLRLHEWPRLDEKALGKPVRDVYRSRAAALEAYAKGVEVR